ncbi:MAG: prolyl oligopeptidase family serine peptidase [Candidatus Binatia bacterium]|nr:prolyl oligopeptidase family serine peptidase [Candidatus Binatia bacterium]
MPTSVPYRESNVRVHIVVALFFLLVGAGCKPAVPGWPRLAPKPTPPGLWSEVGIHNHWITVNIGLPHHGRPPYPVLLNPIVPDHELLERGIGVVRWKTNWEILSGLSKPKATPGPGAKKPETVGAWLLRAPRPGIIGRAYFQLITTEAHETIPAVVDYLLTLPDIDPEQIAIAGSSTGGFTALQALAEEPRLALGVVQVACGEYRMFLQSSSLGLDDQERWLVDGEMVLDEKYGEKIDAIEPAARAELLPPRPLLLLSGAQDRAIPPACVHRSADRFAAAFEAAGVPDRFEWVEFEDLGHDIGPPGQALILEFLERWLVLDPRLLDVR